MIRLLRKNKILKSFTFYTFFGIINAGIPFVLLPVLTHYLTPSDYGILSNINSLFLLLVPLVGVNISSAVNRQYFKEEVNLPIYVSTALSVLSVLFVLFQFLIVFYSSRLESLIKVPQSSIVLVVSYAFLHNIIELLLGVLRMRGEVVSFGIYRSLRMVVEIGLSLVFVIVLNYNWEGRFLGIYINTILFGLIAFVILIKLKLINFVFEPSYAKHLLRFGVPLIVHSISGVLILYSDKIMITNLIGIDKNGIYSVAFQVGMIISFFQTSFNLAWVPWFYDKLRKDLFADKIKIVKVTYIYFLLILILVFLLWLFTPFIFSFLGKEFREGSPVVLIVALGFAFNGMYKMVVNYIFYVEKTYLISLITLMIAFLNVYLNLKLIPKYDILGASYASAISFFVEFLLVWITCSFLYKMPWSLKKMKGSQIKN